MRPTSRQPHNDATHNLGGNLENCVRQVLAKPPQRITSATSVEEPLAIRFVERLRRQTGGIA